MSFWKDVFNDFNDSFGSPIFKQLIDAAKIGDNAFVKGCLDQYPEMLNKQESLSGRTVLMWATAKGKADTVKLLLEKGASLRGRDKSGYNVLHMAVITGVKEKTALLLERKDITSILNEKNSIDGSTALIYASMYPEDTDVVQKLLEKGADPAIKNNKGQTALSIAKAKGFTATATALEQWIEAKRLSYRPKPKRYKL